MATKHLIDPADIRFSRFRLPHENLSHNGKGCLVYHIPTKQTAMAEENQPYPGNKKVALAELAKMLGIEEEVDVQTLFHCKECGQKIVPEFPEWNLTQLYVREYDETTITVYFLEGLKEEELTGWTWDVDEQSARKWADADGALYETPEGAIRAAEEWATEATKEDADDDDQEGEISSSNTETAFPSSDLRRGNPA